MKHSASKYIRDKMLKITNELNSSLIQVQNDISEDEFLEYKYAVGEIMSIILLKVLNDIYQKHPELKPKEIK